MPETIWPTKRRDGTVAVVARFTIDDPRAVQLVQRIIDHWLSAKAEQGIDILDDLTEPPYIEPGEPPRVSVVFHGTASSRKWKDWLVDLTREVREATGAVTVLGFEDLVSGRFRPA